MVDALDARGGILGLPLIRNVKHLDPSDPSTPEVIQVETAMGAAIEVFEGARTIEVGRDRFVRSRRPTTCWCCAPTSTTSARTSCSTRPPTACRSSSSTATSTSSSATSTSGSRRGAPSLREAGALTVKGDWTFGKGVRVVGEVALRSSSAQRIEGGTVLDDRDADA